MYILSAYNRYIDTVADPGFHVGRGENPKIKSKKQKKVVSLKIGEKVKNVKNITF